MTKVDAQATDLLADGIEGPESVPRELSRRGFLQLVGGTGAGLAIGTGTTESSFAQNSATPSGPPFAPGAYVRIAPDGRITVMARNPEMGQGVKTAFALIIAEELDARWEDVQVEQVPVDPAVYGNQFSGGSLSVATSWMTLRHAGAGARSMLVAAAAKRWDVPSSEITTGGSQLRHQRSGRTASYGDLASDAAAMPVPELAQVRLKDRKDFKLLGKRHKGVDSHKIATGQPLLGIDVQVPNMLVAVFQKCPSVYGKVTSANLETIRSLPGVTHAFVVEGTGKPTECLAGVGIVARNTWAALSAKRKLEVVWDLDSASKDSWTQYVRQAAELSKQAQGAQVVQAIGSVDELLANERKVEGSYTYGSLSQPHV